jgi:hypothetical protein
MSKQEFLTLHFKRSKLFMLAKESHGELRFLTGPTREGAIQVPAWVVETPTYKDGIKDGSIVNLTPPEPKIVYVKELPAAEVPSADTEDDDGDGEGDGPKDDEDLKDEAPAPKSRSRKKKKADGPVGLIETNITAQ